MKKTALVILSLLTLCSCEGIETRFELTGSGGKPKMYVECYAGLTDTTYISLYKAMPVNATASDGSAFTLKHIGLSINGTAANVTTLDNTLHYTTDPIPAGAHLAIEVETHETEPVHASTTVPAKPVFTTTSAYVGGMMPMLYFNLKMSETPAGTERFGLSIREHVIMTYSNGDDPFEYYEDFAPTVINAGQSLSDQLKYALLPMPSLYITGYPHSLEFGFYSGEDFKGGEINIATTPYDGDYVHDEYRNWEQDESGDWAPKDTVTVTRIDSLQVVVIKMSDECYGYVNALYNQETDLMAMIGLSPAHFAYTNIAGGYGILAGLTVAESPWYDVQDLIKN